MGVVEKGNKIFVPADKLTATEVTVQWQQNFSQRQQQYYSVPFYNKDLGTHAAQQSTYCLVLS